MTGPWVAPELLAALPAPWGLADPVARGKATRQLPPDPQQRADAVRALELCLAYLMDVKDRYGDETDWGLPRAFFDDYWFVLYARLKQSMPTLADVTPERVRDWAEAYLDAGAVFGATWTTPPDDVIDRIGRSWVFFILRGATESLVRWLRRVGPEHLDESDRARVVDLLKEVTPRLQWRLTIITIPTILDLGGPDEKGYFDRLANEPGLHERTRAEAESVSSCIDRAPEPI
ncbi:hypothetical protein O7631_04250 [Micromonospora sp. WMMD967]|uniref:hypothetical protein n=1 Tax=Micromonospora sp. WMMD967 TaxID=3016101 RepID=UPI002416B9E8|nr:hypothetical protein [Micromonospora sp. WMMD967]MDG4835725.1 hypothetical protein [Micromonospora sp. WMMD967]